MNVKLVKLASGENFFGEVRQEGEALYFKNGAQLRPTREGQVAMVPFDPLLRKDEEVKVARSAVIYVATPADEIIDLYKSQFGGIVTGPSKLII